MTELVRALPLILGAISLAIPFIAIVWLVAGKSHDRVTYLLKVLSSFTWILFVFLAIPWGFGNYYLRYILSGIFVVLFMVSVYKTWSHKFWVRKGFSFYLGTIYILIGLGLGLILNFWVIRGYWYSGDPVALESPFGKGKYVVIQGGNSGVTNFFHHYFKVQKYRYAIDVVKVDNLGFRASQFLPDSLQAYRIYGDTLYSPCNGTIVSVVRDEAENEIGVLNYENPAGNNVVVRCGEVNVLTGHLREGRVFVKEGDTVKSGQPLGEVGNSGYSIEPHLHMQAYQLDSAGEYIAIPMLINGRFPVMNSLIR
ncbi:MAG: M23 family metallopeptidase [Bacteroidia bacterium]